MAEVYNQDSRYQLKNVYEEAVRDTVSELIAKTPDMCRCEKCFLDVCALVLNEGFTRYVTTEKGGLLATLPDRRDNRDVEMLVVALKAIKMVKTKPNHRAKE